MAWEDYIPKARGTAWKLCLPPTRRPHLEDCISVAIVTLWQKSLTFDPCRETTLWTYAQRGVYGAVVDYLRSVNAMARNVEWQPLFVEFSEFDFGCEGSIPHEQIDASVDLFRLFVRLSDREQQVLRLLVIDEMKPVEVAEVLGIGDRTIRMHRARALNRIRGSL